MESGEILTVLGANGSGKSALLETLQVLLAHRGGAVLLDGESVQELAPEVRAARGMSLVSDKRRLFKDMKIDEQLSLGAFTATAPAAAGARKVWHVLPASLAAGRSSSGARRSHGGPRPPVDPGSGRKRRSRDAYGPAHPRASRRGDEGHVSRKGPPFGDSRRRRGPT